MIKNYAYTIGLGILTALLFIFVLCPVLVEPMIGGFSGNTTSSDWMSAFVKACVIASIICTLSVLAWEYLSAHRYPIDPHGIHTQRPYWILHALPPLAAALAGYFIQPPIDNGGLDALSVIVVPIVLQYWLSSVLFSPNPRSVILGVVFRKK